MSFPATSSFAYVTTPLPEWLKTKGSIITLHACHIEIEFIIKSFTLESTYSVQDRVPTSGSFTGFTQRNGRLLTDPSPFQNKRSRA